MTSSILQQLIPTTEQVSSWAFFACLMAGSLFVCVVAFLLMERWLDKAEARIRQRDAEAAEDAYYRQSLEVASQVGRTWPPARKAVK